MPKIKNLKSVIVKYLRVTAVIMTVLVILLSSIILFIREQHTVRVSTDSLFQQMEVLLDENHKELLETKSEYTKKCLTNAEIVAELIENNPETIEDVDSLRNIAKITGVDEIHIFNTEGVIFSGTNPEHYNMSVNDGEQIGFFKQMLIGKDIKLVQDITPNTAEKELIQYSAVWSKNGEFFVQVGMKQEQILKITSKNDIPYIFSMLKMGVEMDLYAVDKQTGKIIGSSVTDNEGMNIEDIGIPLNKYLSKPNGFHIKVNGQLSFCIFKEIDNYIIGGVIPFQTMYDDVIMIIEVLILGIILTAMILVNSVTYFLNKSVILEIKNVNDKLAEISGGNLDERVNVRSCLEFSKLSDHINDMISSLLSNTDKMSYILDRADLQVGVYEYNEKMKTVRFTKKVSKILMLDDDHIIQLSKDCTLFREYLKARIFDMVSEEENIYRLYGDTEQYIKYEEFTSDNNTLGIIMDITEDYNRRKLLEIERDTDSLTGLLNRRGLDNRLETLFRNPDKLGYGAIVMIDADGLKQINDRLGHEAGDVYLKSIANSLKSFGARNSICARQGGDEFVVFFHNLESPEDVKLHLQRLDEIRQTNTVSVSENEVVQIRFSYGASELDGSGNYHDLLKSADEKMYSSKRERKAALV